MAADRSGRLVASAYGVALLMLGVAAADVAGRILPLRLDQTPWRLGSVGVVTLSLPTLLLALLVAALAAWRLEHHRVLRSVAAVSAAGGVLLLAALPFFALDVLEMQRLVEPAAKPSFYATMARAALTMLAAAAVALWLGVAAWRAGPRRRVVDGGSSRRRHASRSEDALIRQD